MKNSKIKKIKKQEKRVDKAYRKGYEEGQINGMALVVAAAFLYNLVLVAVQLLNVGGNVVIAFLSR